MQSYMNKHKEMPKQNMYVTPVLICAGSLKISPAPHLPPSHSPTHQSPGEYQLQKKISLFSRNHTPACVIVRVCVSLTVALHTMFRAVQPMSSGLSRILFILLLILKKLVARISL